MQVDRRELDALRWAIHQPHFVSDWLEPTLFADDTARRAYERLLDTESIPEAIDGSDGDVRALLERLAVEDATIEGEPEAARTRLMVNMVVAAGQRLLKSMVEDDDKRSSELKSLLDPTVHHRETGEWDAAQQAARQLVVWLVDRAHEPEA